MNQIIIIAGPTGVGKSDIAIELAKRMKTEIISADSVQVYKKFDIGSGKVTREEMQGVPHHLLDFVEPEHQYSVQEYQTDAIEKVEEISLRNKLPIVCGGTGLYIHSLLYQLDFSNQNKDPALRRELELIYQEEGLDRLYSILKGLDPDKARQIDRNNHRRIIRAIEIAKSGKKVTFTSFRARNPNIEPMYLVLIRDRQELYQRINQRVLGMIEAGLVQEVESIYEIYGSDIPGLKTIGYKEVLQYMKGAYSLDQMIEKIQQHSRNLAKRQLTWYRREDLAKTIFIGNQDSPVEVAKDIYRSVTR